MKLVQGPPVVQWVAERIPYMGTAERFGQACGIGVVSEDDKLIGGVVFHSWAPWFGYIEASFASDTPKWLTRPLICTILSHPFDTLDCQRITAATPRNAASAHRFLKKFGFQFEGLVRRGFGDDDAVVSGLLREDWRASRWMNPPKRSVEGEQEGRFGLRS